MTQIAASPSDILALFNQSSVPLNTFGSDTGEGFLGKWPSEGDHDCMVTDIIIKQQEFKRKGDDMPVKATTVQFLYKTIGPEPLDWNGNPIWLVGPQQLLDDGEKKRYEIAAKRLNGFIETCLRKKPTGNGGPEVIELLNLAKSGAGLGCKIRVSHRKWEHKGKAGVDRSEYCLARFA